MGFSRREYWSGLPFPLPGDPPDPGIKLRSPALQAHSSPSEPPGRSQWGLPNGDFLFLAFLLLVMTGVLLRRQIFFQQWRSQAEATLTKWSKLPSATGQGDIFLGVVPWTHSISPVNDSKLMCHRGEMPGTPKQEYWIKYLTAIPPKCQDLWGRQAQERSRLKEINKTWQHKCNRLAILNFILDQKLDISVTIGEIWMKYVR